MIKPALSSAVFVLLAFAVAAGPAAAQIKVAGEPAADEPKKEEAAKPKKKAAAKTEKAAKAKKKPAASKYKSTALAESTESSYRFDSDGNPVGTPAKKKAAAKAKKSSEEAAEDEPAAKGCTEDEPCADKSDSDAL